MHDPIAWLDDDRRRLDELLTNPVPPAQSLQSQLAHHLTVVDRVITPAALRIPGAARDEALTAAEAHRVAAGLLAALQQLLPTDERYGPMLRVLADVARAQLDREATTFLPSLVASMDAEALSRLGAALVEADRTVPDGPPPDTLATRAIEAPAPVPAALHPDDSLVGGAIVGVDHAEPPGALDATG